MITAPLDRLDELLPLNVRRLAARDTPIPTIAVKAKAMAERRPELVRGDIGQISGVAPDVEVLYGPPVGIETLRAAVAETWNLTFGLGDGSVDGLPSGLRAENVVICTGAAEGLSLVFKCFAKDKAVGLPRGHWENYTNGVEMADGRPVLVDFFDAKGKLDAEGIARHIREDDLAVLVVNFPTNPTGAVLSAVEAELLARVARDTGVVVVADEVYARLRFDGVPAQTLLRYAPGHVVSVSSASKEYLLPGARVGYALSARATFTDNVLRKLVRASTASPGVLGQTRLLELMQRDLVDLRAGREAGLIVKIRDEMRKRRDLLLQVLDKHGFGTVGRPEHKPEGTIFLMAALPAWWTGNDVDFVHAALEEACVSAIPGAAFGLPGAVRLSFGAMLPDDIARLDDNLQRFRTSLTRRMA